MIHCQTELGLTECDLVKSVTQCDCVCASAACVCHWPGSGPSLRVPLALPWTGRGAWAVDTAVGY